MAIDYNETKTYLILRYTNIGNALAMYISNEEFEEDMELMHEFLKNLTNVSGS